MGKNFKEKNDKYYSREKMALVPEDVNQRKEAIIDFWEFASQWEKLKKKSKSVDPGVLLHYYLKEQKSWFLPVFLNHESNN